MNANQAKENVKNFKKTLSEPLVQDIYPYIAKISQGGGEVLFYEVSPDLSEESLNSIINTLREDKFEVEYFQEGSPPKVRGIFKISWT